MLEIHKETKDFKYAKYNEVYVTIYEGKLYTDTGFPIDTHEEFVKRYNIWKANYCLMNRRQPNNNIKFYGYYLLLKNKLPKTLVKYLLSFIFMKCEFCENKITKKCVLENLPCGSKNIELNYNKLRYSEEIHFQNSGKKYDGRKNRKKHL